MKARPCDQVNWKNQGPDTRAPKHQPRKTSPCTLEEIPSSHSSLQYATPMKKPNGTPIEKTFRPVTHGASCHHRFWNAVESTCRMSSCALHASHKSTAPSRKVSLAESPSPASHLPEGFLDAHCHPDKAKFTALTNYQTNISVIMTCHIKPKENSIENTARFSEILAIQLLQHDLLQGWLHTNGLPM